MAILLVLQSHVSAQVTSSLTAGPVTANYVIKDGGTTVSPSRKIGFTIGGFIDVPMAAGWHFQPGLNLVQKGFKFTDDSDPNLVEKNTLTVNVIELPLNVVFNSSRSDNKNRNTNLIFGGGPSISFAVAGTGKTENQYTTEKTSLKFGNGDNDDMRSMELGCNIVGGVQLKSRVLIMANYNFGFSNLIPGNSSGSRFHSNYFALRIGFTFKGKVS